MCCTYLKQNDPCILLRFRSLLYLQLYIMSLDILSHLCYRYEVKELHKKLEFILFCWCSFIKTSSRIELKFRINTCGKR